MTDRAKCVLVVDDDPAGREALSALLEAWGFEVCAACDGEDALATFVARRPDIVFTDLRLPNADGCDVVRHIRGAAAGEHVLIVAHSGWAAERAALAAGADAFVLKPHLEALESLLGREGLGGVTPRRRGGGDDG